MNDEIKCCVCDLLIEESERMKKYYFGRDEWDYCHEECQDAIDDDRAKRNEYQFMVRSFKYQHNC